MKRLPRIAVILLACCTGSITAAPAAKPNIVIEQKTDVYKFVAGGPDKTVLEKVEHTSQLTFRANRAAGAGIALAYYSDDVKIEKASGSVTTYGPYFGDDTFFSDSKACLIGVTLKKAGATGKASYKRIYTKPEFFCKVILPETYDIENSTMTFEIPVSLASRFSIEERNIPSEKMTRTEQTKGDKKIITYTFTDIATPKSHDKAPSLNITAPQLVIRGFFADVNELYRYIRSYTLNDDPAAGTVAAKAREITAGCTTDAERISAITDFVHNTVRYVAVEHGEFGQRPDLPSEVLRKAYGDCKCSAALIKAMLQAVGIDGRLVWVGTESISDKWTDYPALSSGNHMIAAAVTGDTLLFIDGTARYTRAGDLPAGIQGQQALVEDGPENCIIATIPSYPATDNATTEHLSLTIQPDGNITGNGTITFTGSAHRGIEAVVDETPPGKRDEYYARVFSRILHGSHTVSASMEKTDTCTIITGSMTLGGAVKTAGDETYIDINPAEGLHLFKFDTKDRTVDGVLGYRTSTQSTIVLAVPEGMEATDLPAPVTVSSKWISGSLTTEAADGGRSIVRRYTFTIDDPNIARADMEEYNALIHRLNRACTTKIVLKQK